MQIARAMKTRLPHDSRADLANGSIMPALASAAGGVAAAVAAAVAGGVDEGTGRPAASRCTGWPTGRGGVALLVVDGVP